MCKYLQRKREANLEKESANEKIVAYIFLRDRFSK